MNEKAEAVQRMQDYIEKHLCESITLAELAREAMFSPWYSHRLFTAYTGSSPAVYIRRLRLSRSAIKLRDENCRITDVAFELGFGSVDGYQRAFYREFGCNPGDYAREPVPLYLFTPFGVRISEDNTMSEVKTVYVKQVDKPARKVIIKRGVKAADYWDYCGEVGCDIWGLLTSIKCIGNEPVCLWLPAAYRCGGSEYVQGVEEPLDYNGPIPEGFDVIELPAATYLMFRGGRFAEEDFEKAILELHTAIKNYDPSVDGFVWDDSNPRIQLEPLGSRGYIELLPVKNPAF